MKRWVVVLVLLIGVTWCLHADDHGNSPLTATPVSATEQLISACIEQPGDMDYYLFSAVEGRTYRLLTSHLSSEMDTVIFLFDSDGRTILLVDDNSNGETASRLQWTCSVSGTYFAMIRHAVSLSGTGCYEFSITTLLIDDHGDDSLSATPLSLDVPTAGFIETASDVDVFLFAVRQGFEYVVRLSEAVPASDLAFSILGEDSAWQQGTANDPNEGSYTWTATAAGTLFVSIFSENEDGGGYEVTVTETGYADDYGNEPATAHGLATERTTIDGTIDVAGDRDWFVFDAHRGTEYKIEFSGARAFRLALIASDGTTILREESATGTLDGQLEWTAPADEVYYLSVEMGDVVGNYTLTISSTLQLELLGGFNPQGYSLDIAIRGKTAYLVVGTKGLLIVDVSDPAKPLEIGAHSTRGYAQAVAVYGDYAYIANRGEGLTILDVSDPTRPFEVGMLDTQGSAQDVVVSGTIAYVADQRGGLQIIDVGRPEAPRLLATFDTIGHAEALAVLDDTVFIAVGDAGLELVNVSVPSMPQAIASIELRGDASDVVISDGLAYVAAGFRGIRIVDLSDITSLIEVGYLSTDGEARGLALSSGFLYVAERSEGLSVFSLADPGGGSLVARIDTPGEAISVAVVNGYAYVADREKGMQIIRLFP